MSIPPIAENIATQDDSAIDFDKYMACIKELEDQAKPFGNLYHYTDWGGLQGILKRQRLWLTEYRHLNDTSEIKFAIEEIRNYVMEVASAKEFWKDVFSDIMVNVEHWEFFVCSFSERKNYLYAWRAYANDGAGFSIGFKQEFFDAANQQNPEDLGFGRGKIYCKDYPFIMIKRLVSQTEADLQRFNALRDNEYAIENRIEICTHFLAVLAVIIPLIKHEAYQEEFEYRIYKRTEINEITQKFYSPGSNALSPHVGSKKRMYFEFDPIYIAEIWTGPRLDHEHAKLEIEQILHELKSQGHKFGDIEIIPSNIPYNPR